MANEIQVIKDITYVGFDYINQKWYVRNLDSYVTAEDMSEDKAVNNTKNILDVVVPNNNVSLSDIKALKYTKEPITNIYYSLEQTGKYIESIQFNEYSDYAIVYNEPNIYINTLNELWDMSAGLSTTVIIDYMLNSFLHVLHLDISKETITDIIKYYNSIQKPYVYNVLSTETKNNNLMYSNTIKVNNPNKTSKGEYTGIKNPDNVFNTDILNIKSVSNKQIEVDTVPELDKGNRVYIINKDFPAIVESVTNGSKINFTTNIPSNATGNLVCNAYKINYAGYDNYEKFNATYQIKKMIGHKIYFMQTTMENAFTSGDEIYINGNKYIVDTFYPVISSIINVPETEYTQIEGKTYEVSEYKDGVVNSIGDLVTEESYLTVVETLPDYTFTLKDETPLYVELKSNYKLAEKSITLDILPSVEVGDTINIVNYDTTSIQYTITKIENDKKKIYVKEEIEEYTFETGKVKLVQLRVPSKRILLNMTYSLRANKVPTGEFMLDNDQQFTEYLKNYNIVTPTSTNYGNINKSVDTVISVGDVKMKLLI